MWVCLCSCGNRSIVTSNALLSGNTTACGCVKKALDKVRLKTHGNTAKNYKSPEYQSWSNMIDRCANPNNPQYHLYGGRGIYVCDRWKIFANFLSDMGVRPKGTSLDRFPNNDGIYELSNCRWTTPKQQAANMRSNRWLTYNDKKMILSDWASFFGVKPNTLIKHLNKGRSMDYLYSFYEIKNL